MITIEEADVDREVTKSASRLSRFAENFWMGFREGRGEEGRYPIIPGTFGGRNREGEITPTALGDLYLVIDGALARVETTLDLLKEKPADVENLIKRIRQVRFDMQFIVTGSDRKFVYWLERRNRGVFLRASPIDVAGLLQDKLFGTKMPGLRSMFYHPHAQSRAGIGYRGCKPPPVLCRSLVA